MIHRGLKAIFVHIPRTGGNSISYALRKYPNYDNSVREKHRGALYYSRTYPREFRSFFKFACVRNPFAKLYSHYCFKRIRQDKECVDNDFNSWVRKFHDFDKSGVVFKAQTQFMIVGTELTMDLVMRFENIEKDFEKACERLGIDEELPYLFPSTGECYRDVYEPETVKIVSRVFKPDLEVFGYDY